MSVQYDSELWLASMCSRHASDDTVLLPTDSPIQRPPNAGPTKKQHVDPVYTPVPDTAPRAGGRIKQREPAALVDGNRRRRIGTYHCEGCLSSDVLYIYKIHRVWHLYCSDCLTVYGIDRSMATTMSRREWEHRHWCHNCNKQESTLEVNEHMYCSDCLPDAGVTVANKTNPRRKTKQNGYHKRPADAPRTSSQPRPSEPARRP